MAVRTIGIGHREYPVLLKEIPARPKILYAEGRPIEPAPYVAVVGTRRPTRYGLEVAEDFAAGLSQTGIVVVSGMAGGIDAAAHRGALKAGATTVAVLGCGLDICYPRSNSKLYDEIGEKGTLVSEYEAGVEPLPYHFPARNRIIAGMSLGVVVVEGRANGGGMITARLAGEYGREVFGVPGPIHSPNSDGPHTLINEGCRIAREIGDILEGIGSGFRFESAEARGGPPPLDPDERRVVDNLGASPALLDSIAIATGMPVSTVSSILARLEVKDLVVRDAGGRFSLSPSTPRTLVYRH